MNIKVYLVKDSCTVYQVVSITETIIHILKHNELYIFCISTIHSKMEIIFINFKIVITLGSTGKWKRQLDKERSSTVPIIFYFLKTLKKWQNVNT